MELLVQTLAIQRQFQAPTQAGFKLPQPNSRGLFRKQTTYKQ